MAEAIESGTTTDAVVDDGVARASSVRACAEDHARTALALCILVEKHQATRTNVTCGRCPARGVDMPWGPWCMAM